MGCNPFVDGFMGTLYFVVVEAVTNSHLVN